MRMPKTTEKIEAQKSVLEKQKELPQTALPLMSKVKILSTEGLRGTISHIREEKQGFVYEVTLSKQYEYDDEILNRLDCSHSELELIAGNSLLRKRVEVNARKLN